MVENKFWYISHLKESLSRQVRILQMKPVREQFICIYTVCTLYFGNFDVLSTCVLGHDSRVCGAYSSPVIPSRGKLCMYFSV